MTERQAWLKLAKIWDGAKDDGDDIAYVPSGATGLCPSILEIRGYLTDQVYESMMRAIDDLRSVTEHNHKWPMTLAGAKARAAFCRLQAKLLTRPSAKKANRSKRK